MSKSNKGRWSARAINASERSTGGMQTRSRKEQIVTREAVAGVDYPKPDLSAVEDQSRLPFVRPAWERTGNTPEIEEKAEDIRVRAKASKKGGLVPTRGKSVWVNARRSSSSKDATGRRQKEVVGAQNREADPASPKPSHPNPEPKPHQERVPHPSNSTPTTSITVISPSINPSQIAILAMPRRKVKGRGGKGAGEASRISSAATKVTPTTESGNDHQQQQPGKRKQGPAGQDADRSTIEVAEERLERRMAQLKARGKVDVLQPSVPWGNDEEDDDADSQKVTGRKRKRAKLSHQVKTPEDTPEPDEWTKPRTSSAHNNQRPDWCTYFIFRAWHEATFYQNLESTGNHELGGHDGEQVVFKKSFAGTFRANPSTFPPNGRMARKHRLEDFLAGSRGGASLGKSQDVADDDSSSSDEERSRVDRSFFISFTMSWQEALRVADRLENGPRSRRRVGRKGEATGKEARITVAQADQAASLNNWKMLRVTDTMESYGVTAKRHGVPSLRKGAEHELLILERLPQQAIRKTYELKDVKNWTAEDVLKDLGLSEEEIISGQKWCLE